MVKWEFSVIQNISLFTPKSWLVEGGGGGNNCKIVRKIIYEMVSHLKVLIKQYVKCKLEVFD